MAGRQLHNASILRLLYLYSYNTVIVIHTNVHYSTLHVPIGQTIHCDDMLTMRLKDVQTRSLVVGGQRRIFLPSSNNNNRGSKPAETIVVWYIQMLRRR